MAGNVKSLLILFFPSFAKYFGELSGWNRLQKLLAPRQMLFEKTIQNHQRTLPEGPPRDFIDAYLQEVERTCDTTSIFHRYNLGGKT